MTIRNEKSAPDFPLRFRNLPSLGNHAHEFAIRISPEIEAMVCIHKDVNRHF
jgi:hypothetical protein